MENGLENKVDMSVTFCGVTLKNPIIPASGTFGFGRQFEEFFDISRLGAICVKGLKLNETPGNLPPRIAETGSGILNSVGLQNPGVDAFISEELPYLLKKNTVVIANFAGADEEEYCKVAEKLSASEVHLLECNISCPNVKAGGMAFGATPESVYNITKAVKAVSRQPLIIKLSPNTLDIAANARAAEEAGADAVSLINTLLGMAIDVKKRKAVLGNVMGGLSGPAIKPIALAMVYKVAKAVNIPIIGMGGVMTGEDAAEFMLAGADVVGVGAANLIDPFACVKILESLEKYLEKYKYLKAQDLTDGLKVY